MWWRCPQARKTKTIKSKGRIFLTLSRLRQGFKEEHLSHLYGILQTTVSRITISWVYFMFLKFCKIPVWPSRAKCLLTSRTTRVIIDCTEICCWRPESLCLNSERFSSYKVYTTLKVLVGISPEGTITFTWGGVLPEKLGGDVRPAPQNPYPIYDQNLWYPLPYLWPDQKIDTLFITWLSNQNPVSDQRYNKFLSSDQC